MVYEILIIRSFHPSIIDELVKYYRWFPDITIQKNSKLVNDILKKRKNNDIKNFIEFVSELKIVSERYVTKNNYEFELLYKTFLWYLYHKFVSRYDYLKDPQREK